MTAAARSLTASGVSAADTTGTATANTTIAVAAGSTSPQQLM
ncbi:MULTISPECIES: hypothetical protein [Streptomyces]